MAYKLLDEKRNIWGCELDQIPFSKLQHITDTWGDDPISSISFFTEYEKDTGNILIIMNMSSEDFEEDFEIFQMFIDFSQSKREAFLEKFDYPEKYSVLNEVLEKRGAIKIDKIVKINTRGDIDGFIYPNNEYLRMLSKEPATMIALYRAYTYGFALGKKSERARRKRAKVWKNEKKED